MDNRNLTIEQLRILDGAVSVIDRALAKIDEPDLLTAVALLQDARNAIKGLVTGERLETSDQLSSLPPDKPQEIT